MRIAVLGGTVFIGRAIIEELASAGHELMIIHRGTHEPDGLPDAEHLHLPRAELAGARRELAAFAPDAFIDCVPIRRPDAEIACDVVPAGVRIAMISSMDVYRAFGALHAGTVTDAVPVDESGPVRSERYPYRGRIESLGDYDKLDVEEVYAERDATVLRLPMVYGEHDYQRREEHILRRVRAGRTRIPCGSGAWLGTRGYVRDVATGVRLAIESDDAAGEIFNLGEERTASAGLWARMILDAAGHDAELVRVPDEALPEDLDTLGSPGQHLLVDSSKARRLLDWRCADPMESLRRSVAWHLAHPPEGSAPFDDDDAALERAL